MTSEEIIRVANLALDKYGGYDREIFQEQEFLDLYYSKYGMKEPDPQEEDMWYTMAEKVR